VEESGADVVSVSARAQDIPTLRQGWESVGRETFATDPPPQEPSGWVPVAHFCADRRVNPYLIHDLWLFAPASSPLGRAGPVTACDGR